MSKEIIFTDKSPRPIGTYAQANKVGEWLYVSGQIPLNPENMQLVHGNFIAQVRQVFENIAYVADAAGTKLQNAVKLTVYLTDLKHVADVNEVMTEYFEESQYPARAAIEVSRLPKDVGIEIDAIIHVESA